MLKLVVILDMLNLPLELSTLNVGVGMYTTQCNGIAPEHAILAMHVLYEYRWNGKLVMIEMGKE